MVNNYEQNIASLTKKLKNVTSLLEQKVHVVVPLSVFFCHQNVLYLYCGAVNCHARVTSVHCFTALQYTVAGFC